MRMREEGSAPNLWAGFVDALSALLVVILFALAVFVVIQAHLGSLVSRRDETLRELRKRIASLQQSLRQSGQETDLIKRERSILQDKVVILQSQGRVLEEEKAGIQRDKESVLKEREVLSGKVLELESRLSGEKRRASDLEGSLSEEKKRSADLDGRVKALTKKQLDELTDYRSDFFGKLRHALGSRKEVRIVGDRFVFQSEVLFPLGSADIGERGKAELESFVAVLKTLIDQIPKDVSWVLRVDGHTDQLPVRKGARFASNWELSTARALSVVKFLAEQGIPPQHLAAAGFGEFFPLVKGTDPKALEQNRRIELTLDQKK